eukprot:15353466-Ditylum_brightwellii.AAC.1
MINVPASEGEIPLATMLVDWKFNEEEALMMISPWKVDENIIGERLAGDYGCYMRMMVENHSHYKCGIKDDEDIIVIYYFGGAEHMKPKKK